MSLNREIEMKLLAPDAAALRRLPAALRKLCDEVKPRGKVRIHDTYYDTGDWRFFRANYILRLRRTRKGALLGMKSLHPAQRGLSSREEIEQLVPPAWTPREGIPEGKIRAKCRRIAGNSELRELFQLRNDRRDWECRSGTLKIIASADNFRVIAGRKSRALAEVELEIKSGNAAGLVRLGARLARAMHLSRRRRSKFKEGLKIARLKPLP